MRLVFEAAQAARNVRIRQRQHVAFGHLHAATLAFVSHLTIPCNAVGTCLISSVVQTLFAFYDVHGLVPKGRWRSEVRSASFKEPFGSLQVDRYELADAFLGHRYAKQSIHPGHRFGVMRDA